MNKIALPPNSEEQASILREFAGRWIAIWEDKIVAASDNPDDLFQQMDSLHLPEAAVRRIPDVTVGVFVGPG